MLLSCSDRDSVTQREAVKDSFLDLQEAFRNGDPAAIANLYVESAKFTKESNLNHASLLLKHFKDSKSEVIHTRVSGDYAAIVVLDSETSSGAPMYAKKINGSYRFYRNLNLWGNTNRVQHFGVSEDDLKVLLELQKWAISKIS